MEIKGGHHKILDAENDTLERSKWKSKAEEGGNDCEQRTYTSSCRDGVTGRKATYKESITG